MLLYRGRVKCAMASSTELSSCRVCRVGSCANEYNVEREKTAFVIIFSCAIQRILTYEKPVVDTFVSDIWLHTQRPPIFYSFRMHTHAQAHVATLYSHLTAHRAWNVCIHIAEKYIIFRCRVFVWTLNTEHWTFRFFFFLFIHFSVRYISSVPTYTYAIIIFNELMFEANLLAALVIIVFVFLYILFHTIFGSWCILYRVWFALFILNAHTKSFLFLLNLLHLNFYIHICISDFVVIWILISYGQSCLLPILLIRLTLCFSLSVSVSSKIPYLYVRLGILKLQSIILRIID